MMQEFKSIQDSAIMAAMVNAIKEQQTEIKLLEARVKALESK